MKQLNDPRLRKSLYALLSAVGVALVAYGYVEQATIDSLIAALPGLLMAISGGVAVAHTPGVRHDPDTAPNGLPVFEGSSSVPAEDGGYIGRHRLGG